MFASTLLNKGYEVHVIYKPHNRHNEHVNLPNSIKYVTWDTIQGNALL
jgi:GDP-D-mannose dehydratase